MADFNQYYPNVQFNYEQIGKNNIAEYIEANPSIDIFMTTYDVLEEKNSRLSEKCADLSKEDIDFIAIQSDMLEPYCINDRLVSVPIGQNVYGIVVNKTLLENEGLKVPETYSEFLNALQVLKEKGYIPLQGSESKVYAELTINMLMDMILDDNELYNQVISGDKKAVTKLRPIMDRLNTITDNGYSDLDINKTYPYDNYDESILRFFEGDVPFWVCNSEKVSGMKKRESKSEAFKNNAFEYTYIYAPLGDNGAYVYNEPWYGLAVNKDSANYKYAVEFMRFLATNEEINRMADVKGIPTIAINKNESKIYSNIYNTMRIEKSCVRNQKINYKLIDNWYSVVNNYILGKIDTADEALETYIDLCKK